MHVWIANTFCIDSIVCFLQVQTLLAGGHRYEEGMPYRGGGSSSRGPGKADWGGAPGPYKEGYEKVIGVGASKVSLFWNVSVLS